MNPTTEYKLEEIVKKIYIWHTSEEQLNNAIDNLQSDCNTIAANMQSGLDISRKMNAVSEGEAKYVQSIIDKLHILPNHISEVLKPLCEQRIDKKLALQIDIPKELLKISDMRNVLLDFERNANVFGNLGDYSLEYWIKPNVTEEYVTECNIVKL